MNHPLQRYYAQHYHALHTALECFKTIGTKNEKILFAELCFCLCTPQSKAHNCDRAIQQLVRHNLLSAGDAQTISTTLVRAGVRFHKNKTQYIIQARNTFNNQPLKHTLQKLQDDQALRKWLVRNVKGLGYKEATHFLRNIGRAETLSILDRHILRNLVRYNVIRTLPKTITAKKYYSIEKKMQQFAVQIHIPVAALDLIFWSQETGEIFK